MSENIAKQMWLSEELGRDRWREEGRERGSDGGMKRERRRTMEVRCRLAFSPTACQINGVSV